MASLALRHTIRKACPLAASEQGAQARQYVVLDEDRTTCEDSRLCS